MHDLSGLGIVEGRCLDGLVRSQDAQNAARERGVEPERLQRRDDRIATEGRGKPRYAGIGVGSGRQFGRQERQVGF